jgi:hypothetical protein
VRKRGKNEGEIGRTGEPETRRKREMRRKEKWRRKKREMEEPTIQYSSTPSLQHLDTL